LQPERIRDFFVHVARRNVYQAVDWDGSRWRNAAVTYRNLIVHLDATAACATRLNVAVSLAQRFGARLTGVFAVAENHVQNAAAGKRRGAILRRAAALTTSFREQTVAAGVRAEWHMALSTNDVRVNQTMVRSARHFDMAILGQFDPQTADGSIRADLVEQTVLLSGRPVLVVPYAGNFTHIGRRVIVAWNPNREAVRAVNDALPLLVDADRVILVTLDPAAEPRRMMEGPFADMTGHLASHGIDASSERLVYDRRGIDPADRLLSHIADEAADLLVMGAFSDSNRQIQSSENLTVPVLAHMTVPVLMSH
jgi:nucleotide-binding universal stress UspA family protein